MATDYSRNGVRTFECYFISSKAGSIHWKLQDFSICESHVKCDDTFIIRQCIISWTNTTYDTKMEPEYTAMNYKG